MVAKPGTIILIKKIASEVGPLLSCFCMEFLTSNYFGGRLSAKPAILMVGYLRTRTRIHKSTEYRRERASGKTLGGPKVYKYTIVIQGWVFIRLPLLSAGACCRQYQKLRVWAWYILVLLQIRRKNSHLILQHDTSRKRLAQIHHCTKANNEH